MKKYCVLVAVVLLLVAVVAAQQNVEIKPGMIKADSPLYSLELSFDRMMVNMGTADPSEVTYERASEMRDLQERGKDTAERINRVRVSMEEYANTSVETAGGDITAQNGNIQVKGRKGSISINGGNVHISGPEGEISVTEGGDVNIQGPEGSITVKDGVVRITGPDGTVHIDGEKISSRAENRQKNIQRARIVLQQVERDAPDEALPEIQQSRQRLEQNEQRMEEFRRSIQQQMEELRQRYQEMDAQQMEENTERRDWRRVLSNE